MAITTSRRDRADEYARLERLYIAEVDRLRSDLGRLQGEHAELARLTVAQARTDERLTALDRLTDEKFVRLDTIARSEAARVALALEAQRLAVDKAEAAVNSRLASMNEFREQLASQAATFMPRKEAEQATAGIVQRIEAAQKAFMVADDKMDERVKILEQAGSNLQGRMWALGAFIAVFVLIVNVTITLVTQQ